MTTGLFILAVSAALIFVAIVRILNNPPDIAAQITNDDTIPIPEDVIKAAREQ